VKGLLALVVVGAVLAAAAAVLAIGSTRDPVPGAIKDCVREGGATVVRGQEGLQPVRDDLLARALRPEAPPVAVGQDRAVVLAGARARVLVVATPRGASLDVPDLPTTLYADPSRFSVVAVEVDPVRGLLARCVRAAQ
jgi:hypothetical protein